jgi:peptidoglycan/xylan/chitin deacetylase (PgdA/CDA1 family)
MRNKIYTAFIISANIIAGSKSPVFSQEPVALRNTVFLKKLNNDKTYLELRNRIVSDFRNTPAGKWGEFVNGVDEVIQTRDKTVAFTFDACGGKNGNGYDKELIEYLRSEKIPATLFISGKWIDAQFDSFVNLSRDSLFDIENHGLNHRPCSKDGKTAYGIKGTVGMEEAFDEIEANARKIEAITNHRPSLYRSATDFSDEACVKMASSLGISVISYEVLSGDAVAFTPKTVIEENVLKKIKPGAIISMHFNHPEWYTKEALENIVPVLRQKGYSFVLLKDYKLAAFHEKSK